MTQSASVGLISPMYSRPFDLYCSRTLRLENKNSGTLYTYSNTNRRHQLELTRNTRELDSYYSQFYSLHRRSSMLLYSTNFHTSPMAVRSWTTRKSSKRPSRWSCCNTFPCKCRWCISQCQRLAMVEREKSKRVRIQLISRKRKEIRECVESGECININFLSI